MKFSGNAKLFIITGSNGAGKSTYKQTLLPLEFRSLDIFDGDIFCGLNTLIRSIQRVALRVKKGGFHVTNRAIENNYFGNMQMLDQNFSMFDSVELIDTSNLIIPIAKLSFGVPASAVRLNQIPEWIKKGMPVIFKTIEAFNDRN